MLVMYAGFLLILIVIYILITKVFPVISGYGAKTTCSNVFIGMRSPEHVLNNDLASFPLNLARVKVDFETRSVTASVCGFAMKKAIYQDGIGCTLLHAGNQDRKITPMTAVRERGPVNRDSLAWPMGNKLNEPIQQGINTAQLEVALKMAFDNPGESLTGTRALIVLHQGEVVAEQYADGFNASSKIGGWSLAKSVTNALVGILVGQNLLKLDDPVSLPAWKKDARNKVTVRHLLQMSSGLRWWEFYAAPSDATNMLYREENMGLFALKKKLKHEPRKVFSYSSGSTNILSYIIRQVLPPDQYHSFPYDQLFSKVGMYDTVLEADAGGTFVGSSYCLATARDWARFGLLYLNNGRCNGQQVLPKDWVEFTTTPTTGSVSKSQGNYGAHWWLNKAGTNGFKKYLNVPEDCYSCQGYEGQYIWVIPSKQMVIVRLALEKRIKLDPNLFLPAVFKAFV